jgi:hypothetical protein
MRFTPFAAALALSCNQSTSPASDDISAHRAIWSAQGFTSYTYQYRMTGFFNNLANQEITLDVRHDTILSAVLTGSGDSIVPAAYLPSINSLFEQAALASANHTLTGIQFDPVLGYPVQMDLAGPPDASGSLFASSVQRQP